MFLSAVAVALLVSSCGGKSGNGGDATVIRITHLNPRAMDTSYRDPVTGEPGMSQQEMVARLYAEQQILEKFNVKFQWLEYGSGGLSDTVLRTVLAGDPVAEILHIFAAQHGALLAQNSVQPIDDFADYFQDEDSSWMLMGKIFGHNYFINDMLRGPNVFFVYNINILDKVPALKENGKLVQPVDLWLDGKWTWSVFEDYLQKIQDFYRDDDFVYAYPGGAAAGIMAIYSNGGSVYGNNGLEMDSVRTKEAVAWLEGLMARRLAFDPDIDPVTGRRDVWVGDLWRFRDGGYAFAHLDTGFMRGGMGDFNERGDTMGVVPFPRPDRMDPDDPEYRQVNDVEDVYAIARGVSHETADLAVQALREYMVSYYRKLANSDRVLDYLQTDEMARARAMSLAVDVTNEDYGDKMLEAWKYLHSNQNVQLNEYFRAVGLFTQWVFDILLDSLYRVNGASQFSVQVEAKLPVINDVLNTIQTSLSSTGAVDNIPPRFTDIGNTQMAFAAGTDPAAIDWSVYLEANDGVDGVIDFANVVIDSSSINFTRPGRYENAAVFTVHDKAGNEDRVEKTVIVFDGANTIQPSLTVRSDFRTIRLNENTDGINWRGDFINTATDKDGIDIRDSVFADLSELNTTVAGTYGVTLYVRDYAGNETSRAITVTVE